MQIWMVAKKSWIHSTEDQTLQFSTPEQNSRHLQQAQKHLASVQDQHARSLRDLRELRQRMHGLTGPAMPNDEEEKAKRKAAIAETRAALEKAITKRDQARQELEGAKASARQAEQRACLELVDSAKPDYSKAVAKYWQERLGRIESEGAALWQAFSIREAMELALGIHRSSKVARLTAPARMIREYERLKFIRDDVQELIAAGVISAKDCPASLRKIWNL